MGLSVIQAGDRLIIGGGMVREIVEVRPTLRARRVILLRDGFNQRVEKLDLDQVPYHMGTGWVRVAKRES